MLVSKLWTDTRALLDILTENGTLLNDSEVADEQAKFIRFADMAQNELALIGNLYKTHEFENVPDTSEPDYQSWLKVSLPDDLKSIDSIIELTDDGYKKSTNFRLEGYKDLYIDNTYESNYRIVYKAVPTAITAITDSLEIDDISARAITYYCASRLAVFTNKELVQFYEDKYNELKAEIKSTKKPTQTETIIDVY